MSFSFLLLPSFSFSFSVSYCFVLAALVPLDLCTNQVLALYGFQQMTKVFMSIFMVGMGLGQSAQYAPDAAKV